VLSVSGEDLILLGLFGVGLLAILGVLLRRRRRASRPAQERRPWILVDGSNVMHWQDSTPQLSAVRQVIEHLKAKGFAPGVVFDANAGWKLSGKYLNERDFAQMLALPQDQLLVVPKGTPADPWILATARDFRARVVTNDRYRDWIADYPEIGEPGFLIRGEIQEGRVVLKTPDLSPDIAMEKAVGA
jgi:LPXTG-motif cell wall-anchored protein